tara:strand:- start:295 stop:1275 length:981 start_codon:yes stop_codon:yes gene_type:complete
MGGSGGGGGPTQTTTNTSNLPEYAQPYYERMMERAESESNQNYVGYQSPRLAGFAPDQTAGFGITRNIAARGTPQTEAAGQIAGAAAARGFASSGYRANPIEQSSFGSEQAEQYMSPYMQQVIDRQKASAVQDYQEGRPSRETEAIKAGAFGGYRQGIQEGVAQRGLGRQLSDIEGAGRQKAFEQAQGQFERDRTASMQAQTQTEQQRLQAAQYGLSGAGLGLQSAQSMGQLEAMGQGLGMQQADALQRQGGAQQNLQQQALDVSYQDFLTQRDYERNRINFMSNILRGVPITPETASRQYSNPNPLTQVAGLGIAGLGAYNQYNR